MCFLKSGNLQQSYLELLTPVSQVRALPWLQKRIGKGGELMGWPQESLSIESWCKGRDKSTLPNNN